MDYFGNTITRSEAQTVIDIINRRHIKPIEEEQEIDIQQVGPEQRAEMLDGKNLDNILRAIKPPLSRIIPRGMVERLIQDPGLLSSEQSRLDALLATFLLKTQLYKKDVRVRQYKNSDKTAYLRDYLRFVLFSMDRQDELIHDARNGSPRSPAKRTMKDDPGERRDCFSEWLHEPDANLGPRSAHSSPAVPDIGHRVAKESVTNRVPSNGPTSYDQLYTVACKKRRTNGTCTITNAAERLPYHCHKKSYYMDRKLPSHMTENLNSNSRQPPAWSSDDDEPAAEHVVASEIMTQHFHDISDHPPGMVYISSDSDRSITDYLADIWGPQRTTRFAEDTKAVNYVTTPARINRRASPYPRDMMMAVSDSEGEEEVALDGGRLTYYHSTQDAWDFLQARIRALPTPPGASPRSDSGDNVENMPDIVTLRHSKSFTQPPGRSASHLAQPSAAIWAGRMATSQTVGGRPGQNSSLRVYASGYGVPTTYLRRSISAPSILERPSAVWSQEARTQGTACAVSSYVSVNSFLSAASGTLYSSESDRVVA